MDRSVHVDVFCFPFSVGSWAWLGCQPFVLSGGPFWFAGVSVIPCVRVSSGILGSAGDWVGVGVLLLCGRLLVGCRAASGRLLSVVVGLRGAGGRRVRPSLSSGLGSSASFSCSGRWLHGSICSSCFVPASVHRLACAAWVRDDCSSLVACSLAPPDLGICFALASFDSPALSWRSDAGTQASNCR